MAHEIDPEIKIGLFGGVKKYAQSLIKGDAIEGQTVTGVLDPDLIISMVKSKYPESNISRDSVWHYKQLLRVYGYIVPYGVGRSGGRKKKVFA